MEDLQSAAREVLKRHKRALGKDFAVIDTALAEREQFDAECRALKAEVEGLRGSRKSLHDEYAQHALSGLCFARGSASDEDLVRKAFGMADIAMAHRA